MAPTYSARLVRWLPLVALLGALCPAPVAAQVLCPATTYTENALSAELTAAADVRQGNAESLWLHESLCGRFEYGLHWTSLRLTHAFGKARLPEGPEGRFVHALRMLPQYRYRLTDLADSGALRAEVLLHYERDELRRIAHRLQPGLGPNFSFMDTDRVRLSFTLAYVLEYQRTEGDLGGIMYPTSDDGVDHRGWGSLELGWDAHEHVFVGVEAIAQMAIDHNPRDTRLYAQAHLRVAGTQWLSLELGALVLYDPRPVVAVDEVDLILRSGLVFSL